MTASRSEPVPEPPKSETRPVAVAPNGGPVPCLRLFADEVVIHRTEGLGSTFDNELVPLLELSFEYEGVKVLAADEDDEVMIDLDRFVPRSQVDEARARRMLESFGAVPLECLDDYACDATADYVVRCEGNVHDFCGFSAYVVPQLRGMGWKVDVDPKYPFKVVQGEPAWQATVTSGPSREGDAEGGEKEALRPDWFGIQLGVVVDGKRVNLLPALLELLERSNGKPLAELAATTSRKCLALPVGDGLYLPIPAERARAILRVLAELYDGTSPKGELRVHPTRAGAVLALDEIFAKNGGEISFGGDARALAVVEEQNAPVVRVEQPKGLQATLRDYQIDGVSWLQNLRQREVGGILADDMGLGKTLQTIAHVMVEKEGGRLTTPALIIAPTSLVMNWQREFRKFAPELRVLVVHGSDRASAYDGIRDADVVVTSYPIVCRDEEKFAEWEFHLVILDEAQTIKNMKSRAHVACRSIVATHRLALSGTPVENHLGELWSLLDFVNPGLLGDELHFNRFYRVPIERLRNEDRLAALRELVAPYILRRNKRDVAKELPKKTEVMRPVELHGQQRELYESIRVAAHAEVRKLIKKKGLAASTIPILGALTKLRQVCCDPRLVRMTNVALPKESAKYRMFFDLLDKQLAGGHRVLVFSQFTSMLGLLEQGLVERKVKYAILTGSTADRAEAVDQFEKGGAKVFLISLKAGGTGLTLTSADVVIHYDPWWNPAIQAQATDRAYRIGQKKPVISYQLFAAGSVEERILGLQRSKKHVADAILGQGPAGNPLGEAELDILFAPLGA
ncbi:MAG: DEAD/DEAH box helicase [Labilithrix sp.]|nr:DEAD/DEAH box helicase [Labilithrix sp.]MCW5813487.1 DEAD/DEAH box helicase [Labilithrix sp.]